MTRQCTCGHTWPDTEAMRAECEPAGIMQMAGAVIEQGHCPFCGSTISVTCRKDTDELARLDRYHALAYAGYVADRVPAAVVDEAAEMVVEMREWLEQVEAIQ